MIRRRTPLVAACLLAFWLVATQHCGLEAAGLLETHATAEGSCCAGGEAPCSDDACAIVEGGDYRILDGPLKVASPQLVVAAPLPALVPATPPLDPPPRLGREDPFFRPLEWVVTWQFVRRAAAPAHAPDTSLA